MKLCKGQGCCPICGSMDPMFGIDGDHFYCDECNVYFGVREEEELPEVSKPNSPNGGT